MTDDSVAARVAAVEEVIEGMGSEMDDLTQRIAMLEVRLTSARVHGAVDLPCLVENITHLRAKGEITLPVQFEGQGDGETKQG